LVGPGKRDGDGNSDGVAGGAGADVNLLTKVRPKRSDNADPLAWPN